jgi:hypothetical protein
VIVEWPLATRDEIVATFKLGADIASDSPFKTLRQTGIVSQGVRVLPRHDGRLSGQKVFYSSLCIHAARLARHGRLADARRLSDAASEIESMADTRLVAQAAVEGKLVPLLLERLASRTADVLKDFEDLLGGLSEETAGHVVTVANDTVIVMSQSSEWCLLRRTLPDVLAVPGSPVVVVTEWLGAAGALVTARPGVRVTPAERPDRTAPAAVRPLVPVPLREVDDLRSAIRDAIGSVQAEGLYPPAEVREAAERVAAGTLDIDEFVGDVLRRFGATARAAE